MQLNIVSRSEFREAEIIFLCVFVFVKIRTYEYSLQVLCFMTLFSILIL